MCEDRNNYDPEDMIRSLFSLLLIELKSANNTITKLSSNIENYKMKRELEEMERIK